MKAQKNDLSSRMKRYEKAYQHNLTPRSCLIIRIDGRSFHSFTKNFDRPFDEDLIECMQQTTEKVAEDMQGFKLAYTQSDEASFLLTDFDDLSSEGWFDYKLSKVVSASASLFTGHFNRLLSFFDQSNKSEDKIAFFDSRAFIVPYNDVANYFVFRAKDWERSSISMLAQSHFSHSELYKKNKPEMIDMLFDKRIRWGDLESYEKNGTFLFKENGSIVMNSDILPTYNDISTLVESVLEKKDDEV